MKNSMQNAKRYAKRFGWGMGIVIIGCMVSSCSFIDQETRNTQNTQNIPPQSKQEQCRIIALGDSLTAGYNLPPDESYPAQLEKILQKNNYNCTVVNAGVSGDTTKNLLERLNFSLGNDQFTLAILTIGGNDGLQNLPIDQMEKNISTIVEELQKKNIPVLLGGMQMPANAGLQSIEFKNVYPKVAESKNIPIIPFFLEGVALNPTLNLPDGIHPNPQGYSIVAKNVFDHIEKYKLLTGAKKTE